MAQAAAAGKTPREWYPERPASPDAWGLHARSIQKEFVGNDWLSRLGPAFDARGVAADRLVRAGREGGIVVTTGQQPGLFGGPIYAWTKALSALALADAVEAASGVATAPVFWAATDDADFAEASVTHTAVPGGVETLRLPEPAMPGASMSEVPLGDVSGLLAGLWRGAGSARDSSVIALVRDAYAASNTVGGAFVALLRRILEPLGIAVLDASHPAVREASRPILNDALRYAEPLEAALRGREDAIRSARFQPQVAEVRGLSLVFGRADGRRARIPFGRAADSLSRGARLTLGPNVLLRPVVERAILPTGAYVAGPGELAYFAQVSQVAETLGKPAPLVMPRWSCLIVEPHIERILDRYGLAVDDMRDPHAAETSVARAELPDAVKESLLAARESITRSLGDLGAAARRDKPPLLPDSVIEGAARAAMHRLDRLERRLLAAEKRRKGDAMRDLATASGALFPFGKPQERVLNLMPLLARHGTSLLQQMLAGAREHITSLGGLSRRDAPVDSRVGGETAAPGPRRSAR